MMEEAKELFLYAIAISAVLTIFIVVFRGKGKNDGA